MDIKDLSSIAAIAISLLSLIFSLFNFSVTRNDSCAAKRKEIINNLMEANLFFQRTQSHFSKIENNANKILGKDEVSMKSEKSQAENILNGIDSIMSSMQNKKKMRSTDLEGLYVASKRLLVAASNLHSETLADVVEY